MADHAVRSGCVRDSQAAVGHLVLRFAVDHLGDHALRLPHAMSGDGQIL